MPQIIQKKQLRYLTLLRPEPDPIIREMEKLAADKQIPILNWQAGELLEQIILVQRPKNILEIGTAIGYSSIRIARLLKGKSVLDTIEKSKPNIKLASGFLKKAGLGSKVNLIEGDALEIMPLLKKSYDLIFLDADKKDYERLFLYSISLLKKGGMIFIDNLLWHGYAAPGPVPLSHASSAKIIRQFNKEFLNCPDLKSAIIPVGDGIGLGIKLRD